MIALIKQCSRAAALAFIVAVPAASAQTSQGVPNALQGFTQNRDKPVQIRAQSFEIRDKQKTATFTGNVHVVQGDTTIRCRSLIVTYEPNASEAGARASKPGPGGSSQISKLDALGGVIVTQKDQTATGDAGHFDLKTNIITLTGNVVLSQGGNVMRGERMWVNLDTGVSRLESGKSRGQVEMSIQQNGSPAPPGTAPNNKPGLLTREPPKFDFMRPNQQN
jgi:lipopolysaccharide export system protein LptA